MKVTANEPPPEPSRGCDATVFFSVNLYQVPGQSRKAVVYIIRSQYLFLPKFSRAMTLKDLADEWIQMSPKSFATHVHHKKRIDKLDRIKRHRLTNGNVYLVTNRNTTW